jgi:hypothetical protein
MDDGGLFFSATAGPPGRPTEPWEGWRFESTRVYSIDLPYCQGKSYVSENEADREEGLFDFGVEDHWKS